MALNIYSDSGTTTLVYPNEVFTGNGSNRAFALQYIPSVEDVASVYTEVQTSYVTSPDAGVTFTAGVSSTLTGANYVINELKGCRVIHNGEFRGCVLSNTADTVTLDVAYTQAEKTPAIICVFTKKLYETDYTMAGNTVTFKEGKAPANGVLVHAIPTSDVGLAFGGATGDSVTSSGSIWLKREAGYEYQNLKVYSQDNSVADNATITQADVTSTGTPGVMSGFSGLATNEYAGLAVWHNGGFRGIVVSNTATQVTLDRAYTQASPYEAQLFQIGSLELSLNGTDYDYVVTPSNITTDAAVRIYFRDTVTVPSAPMNYPNVTIKVTGTEFLVA